MRQNSAPLLVSSDPGLLRHWRSALGIESPIELSSFAALKGLVRRTGDIVWLDLAVADIPRTKSGKITELAVRDVVHGREVKNKEALANPEALDLFRDLPDLRS